MQNADDLSCEVPSDVVSPSESFAMNAFVSCDQPLSKKQPLQLLDPILTVRGSPSLSCKKNIVYPIEDPTSSTVPSAVLLSSFPKYHAGTLRFFSVYATCLPTPIDSILVQVPKALENFIIVRVQRTVRHPVTQGCMALSGCCVEKSKTLPPRWNLYWGSRWKDDAEFQKLLPHQRVNHFPGTFLLGNKGNLAHYIRLSAQRKRKAFDFVPFTYSIPADLVLLRKDMSEGGAFIAKPAAGARGEGIFLFSKSIPEVLLPAENPVDQSGKDHEAGDAQEDDDAEPEGEDDEKGTTFIVQRYIPNPLLINGYKVDLRLYVVCMSFDPLRLYLFNDGLVRFASSPYPTSAGEMNFSDTRRHLTNYSVNKKSLNFRETNNASEDGTGSKWSLHALKRFFAMNQWDWETVWSNIESVVVKTFVAVESGVVPKVQQSVKFRSSCFELYGFDVLLDTNFKPHLIEVNVMPSLSCGSALDKHIKGHMIADLFTLVGVPTPFGQSESVPCASPSNNIPWKSAAKSDRPVDQKYFQGCSEEEKQVLREYEEESKRSGGFQRIYPTTERYTEMKELFTSSRHYNLLLGEWEVCKSKLMPTHKQNLLAWLNNEGAFPGIKSPLSRKSAPKEVLRPKQSPSTPKLPLIHSRVNSQPKIVTEKVCLRTKQQQHAIPVQVFGFPV